MKRKFLLCPTCGNLIEMLNDRGVTPNCCGNPMQELTPNIRDAAQEKHIPIISINNDIVTISVSEIPHPMTDEHYITWIYLETNKRVMRLNLKPHDEPKATFTLSSLEEVISAYAYCNLHSLWLKENK